MKTLVLGLGNDILSDDAVGILAARRLAEMVGDVADVIETSEHGVALMDYLVGYKRAIIIDAIRTRTSPPGTILEIHPEQLRSVYSPSPHYAGLPEMIRLAQEMKIPFPSHITIFAVEILDMVTLGGRLSPPVTEALERVVGRVNRRLRHGKKRIPAGREAGSALHYSDR